MRVLADQRSLRGAPAVLSWQPVTGDGTVYNPGTVTVTVTRDNGTALVTDAATTGTGEAARTYTLAATHTQLVDLLTVSWQVSDVEVGRTSVEIVGGYFATNPQISERQPKTPGTLPADAISQVRAEVEQEFEDACNVAFVPRYKRERIPVLHSTYTLVLSEVELRAVRACVVHDSSTSSSTLTPTELAALKPNRGGLAVRDDGGYWPGGSFVEITYEHGYDRPSQRVVRAFLDRLSERLHAKNSGISPRATVVTNENGTTNYAPSPGNTNYITGNYEVDKVLLAEMRYRHGIA
jgi:hypothetical protein